MIEQNVVCDNATYPSLGSTHSKSYPWSRLTHMTTPEARARIHIDARLHQAGWLVQDVSALNLGAGTGVAVRESAI